MEPVVVEVKHVLAQGRSLLNHMMETVDGLNPGQPLIVKSTFNPRPLIAQMRRKGYTVTQDRLGKLTVTTFTPEQGDPASGESAGAGVTSLIEGPEVFLDNRGLTPPEPMQRTLARLAELGVGTVLVIHNDRVPVFLLAQLEEDGYPFETRAQPDRSAIVRILKDR